MGQRSRASPPPPRSTWTTCTGAATWALVPGPVAGRMLIVWAGRTDTVELWTTHPHAPPEKEPLEAAGRLLDVGASYTSASALFKLDLAGNLGVERPGYEVSADATSTVTSQTDVEDTRRSTLSVDLCPPLPEAVAGPRPGPGRAEPGAGFDLRGSGRRAAAATWSQGPQDKLLAGLGLEREPGEAASRERRRRTSRPRPRSPTTGSLRLSEGGRVRGRRRVRQPQPRRALPPGRSGPAEARAGQDFYATLRGYESYDSRPATEGAPRNDYGITFALGWSF